jgi:hypothetical protein
MISKSIGLLPHISRTPGGRTRRGKKSANKSPQQHRASGDKLASDDRPISISKAAVACTAPYRTIVERYLEVNGFAV